MKIKVGRLLYLHDVQFFKNLLEKFGGSISLELRYIETHTFESSVECIQSIAEVVIDLEYLCQLCMHCKHFKKLVIHLPFKIDEDSFVCVSRLKDFKQLVLIGDMRQNVCLPWSVDYSQLSITNFCDILKNTKPITKIQFVFIEILEKVSILGRSESGSISLGKLTSEAEHITEWHLRCVTSCQTFNFPSTIKLLDCSEVRCVSLEELKKSNIETLILKNCCCDAKRFNFLV